MKTKADIYIRRLPEMVFPSRMVFDDGSAAEIAGIRFVDWQVVHYVCAIMANPLLTDANNIDHDKITRMAFDQADSVIKLRKQHKTK